MLPRGTFFLRVNFYIFYIFCIQPLYKKTSYTNYRGGEAISILWIASRILNLPVYFRGRNKGCILLPIIRKQMCLIRSHHSFVQQTSLVSYHTQVKILSYMKFLKTFGLWPELISAVKSPHFTQKHPVIQLN